MKIFVLSLATFLFVFSSCSSPNTNSNNNTSTYNAPDDAAIKKAVDNAYTSLSFKQGEQPHYDSIQYAFIPQAQLINYIGDTAQILSISNFIRAYKNYVQTTNIKNFQEEELYGKTDQFGNIAQRISSYKTYINSADIVKERGVNSFQLIKTSQGWKVSSIIWDVEKTSLPIPNYYLGK